MSLISIFDATAEEHPDGLALDLPDQLVTYSELRELSNAVAAMLVGGDTSPVALLADRSLASYAGYLGVLRSGRVVVPISPDLPAKRVQDIAHAAGVKLCLGAGRTAAGRIVEALDSAGVETALMDVATRVSASATDPTTADRPDAAYLLHTSGSTGRPKGVPIGDRHVESFLRNMLPQCGGTPESRFSHNFDLTFDPSVYDMFAAWAVGAALVIPSTADKASPERYAGARSLTHWCSVPSMIALLGANALDCESLVFSSFIGEPLLRGDAERWRRVMGGRILNIYGPTELTVACSAYAVGATDTLPDTANDTVPIGEVFPDLDYRVLDDSGSDADVGELCVRGPQRFDGYLNPEDNIGRFLAGSADEQLRTKLSTDVQPEDWYRTGDLVRRTDALGLIHLGRVDRQVKVRGYRIELEEVEGALRRSGLFDEVVVVVLERSSGMSELGCGFVGRPLAPHALQEAVSDLPSYMRPTRVVQMLGLPRTTNGKLDYEAIVQRLKVNGNRVVYR